MNTRIWFVHFLFGLSSGIPLLLTGSTLQVWMTDMKVDIKTIGAFALVGLPYNLKFLWSPFIDRYSLPFLTRRRAWLFVSQIALMVAILLLGGSDPLSSLTMTAFMALLVSFMSATQDILIDAYRRESLTEAQMGFGLSLYSTGYRIGMLVAGAMALWMVDQFKWNWFQIYSMVAAFICFGMLATFMAPEGDDSNAFIPPTLREAIVGPFREFFKTKNVFMILAFILFYKLGDNLSGALTAPFVIEHGYSKTEYAAAVKGVGLISLLVGGFVGAGVMARIGLNKSLWVFGVLQALAISGLVWLSGMEKNNFALALVIGTEMFTAGMAVPAFNTFVAFLTDKKFTATQYALLTSLVALPRTLISAPAGVVKEGLGSWSAYFIFCSLMTIPGLLLLMKVAPLKKTAKT
jgi:PAT family beta-lactamase induction signal transducer AmpG